MIMDYLGPSLEELHEAQPNQRFSLKTTLMIVDQLIERLEFLHNKDYVYPFLRLRSEVRFLFHFIIL